MWTRVRLEWGVKQGAKGWREASKGRQAGRSKKSYEKSYCWGRVEGEAFGRW